VLLKRSYLALITTVGRSLCAQLVLGEAAVDVQDRLTTIRTVIVDQATEFKARMQTLVLVFLSIVYPIACPLLGSSCGRPSIQHPKKLPVLLLLDCGFDLLLLAAMCVI